MVTLVLFLTFLPQAPADLPELKFAVSSYWDLLQARQKSQALEFVAAGSRDNFVLRSEPFFRSWKLQGIEARDSTGYTVTVVVERLTRSGPIQWKVSEPWVIEEGRWRVRVQDPAQALRTLWQGDSSTAVQAGVLEVFPERLSIHFLSRLQQASILIRNGLEQEVAVAHLEFERELFELAESAAVVGPGQTARLTLRYTGDEIAKDLESRVRLILEKRDGRKELTIPITYNYLSPGARAILGLTPEEAERLERGATLTPRISRPEPPKGRKRP